MQKFEVDVIFAILLQSAAIPFIACPKKPSHRPLASGQGGTVDQSEASKFDYGASGWWEPGGATDLLRAMNTLRVPLVKNSLLGTPADDVTALDHTPYPLRGYRILDVGCGAGLLCEVRSTVMSDSDMQNPFSCLHV